MAVNVAWHSIPNAFSEFVPLYGSNHLLPTSASSHPNGDGLKDHFNLNGFGPPILIVKLLLLIAGRVESSTTNSNMLKKLSRLPNTLRTRNWSTFGIVHEKIASLKRRLEMLHKVDVSIPQQQLIRCTIQ